jgi:hypothetical protein
MKKTLLAALAIAGFAAATSAQAQTNYNTGDTLLFFRSTLNTNNNIGAGNSLLINLGSIGASGTDYNGTKFFSAINLDLSGNDSIVSQTFGTNWWNNANLRWGVIGSAQDNGLNTNTFSYRLSGITTPPNLNMESRVGLANAIDNAAIYAFGMPVSTTGLINNTYRYGVTENGYMLNQPTVDVVTETFVGSGVYVTNAIAQDDFVTYGEGQDIAAYDKSSFGGILDGPVSKDITLNTTLDLYAANNTVDRAANEITSAGAPVQFGTLRVSNGVVTAVPEPSTYALFGFAALILIVAYRRANA